MVVFRDREKRMGLTHFLTENTSHQSELGGADEAKNLWPQLMEPARRTRF
jgi:hypothetical protein